MRRSPTILAALGAALTGALVLALGLCMSVGLMLASSALAQQRPPVLSVAWQQPSSTAFDAGLVLLDGGVGPIVSAPYLVRPYSEARNQTPTCVVAGYGANLGATVLLNVNILGSNGPDSTGVTSWVLVRDGGVLTVDAGFAYLPTLFWDITSGFPYQEIQVSNVGSDGGWLTCTTAIY